MHDSHGSWAWHLEHSGHALGCSVPHEVSSSALRHRSYMDRMSDGFGVVIHQDASPALGQNSTLTHSPCIKRKMRLPGAAAPSRCP